MVGVKTCTVTLEISVTVLHTVGDRSSYATPEHIPKVCVILPQGYLFNHVHYYSTHNSQKLETTYMSSIQEQMKKVWYIFTVEYCSAVKEKMASGSLQSNR